MMNTFFKLLILILSYSPIFNMFNLRNIRRYYAGIVICNQQISNYLNLIRRNPSYKNNLHNQVYAYITVGYWYARKFLKAGGRNRSQINVLKNLHSYTNGIYSRRLSRKLFSKLDDKKDRNLDKLMDKSKNWDEIIDKVKQDSKKNKSENLEDTIIKNLENTIDETTNSDDQKDKNENLNDKIDETTNLDDKKDNNGNWDGFN